MTQAAHNGQSPTRHGFAGGAPLSQQLAETLLALLKPQIERIVEERIKRLEQQPKWLNVEQTAGRIGSGPSAVRERLRQGHLQGTKWMGRWFVASPDIDAAIEGARASATVSPSFQTSGPSGVGAPPALATRRNP